MSHLPTGPGKDQEGCPLTPACQTVNPSSPYVTGPQCYVLTKEPQRETSEVAACKISFTIKICALCKRLLVFTLTLKQILFTPIFWMLTLKLKKCNNLMSWCRCTDPCDSKVYRPVLPKRNRKQAKQAISHFMVALLKSKSKQLTLCLIIYFI